jgi:pimeloyl-ACP methyl ester carboxylesterase
MKTLAIAGRSMVAVAALLAGCAAANPAPSEDTAAAGRTPAPSAAGSEDGGPSTPTTAGSDDGSISPLPGNGAASGVARASNDAADGGSMALAPQGAALGSDAGGPCTITAMAARCDSLPIVTVTDSADSRAVYWAQPLGSAPQGGWPAAVLFQGTGFGPAVTWNVAIGPSTPFGGYYQVAVVAALIDAGFVVIQPPANGAAWDTNFPGNYDTSPDAAFIPQLLSEIGKGTFGPVDVSKLYATGISSGGYMTSRMAVSYAGRFRALAIESGSYATCVGPVCSIPAQLPADHPPTLFLHGGADTIVPISTAQAYYQELMTQGFDTRFVEDPNANHQWLSVAPQEVVRWFTTH